MNALTPIKHRQRKKTPARAPFVGWICMFKNAQYHVFAQSAMQAGEYAIKHFRIPKTQVKYLNVALASGDWASIIPPDYPTDDEAPPQASSRASTTRAANDDNPEFSL